MLNEEKSSSKSQQRLMGMVYAYEKGDLKLDKLPQSLADKIKGIANGTKRKTGDKRKKTKGISMNKAKDFASTKHKGLPETVKEDLEIIKFGDYITESIESNIKDDLELNFNSWRKNADNADDTETLTNALMKKFPDIKYDKIYNIAKEWTGFNGDIEDIKEIQDKSNPRENEISVDIPGGAKGELVIDEPTGNSNESAVLNFEQFLNEKKNSKDEEDKKDSDKIDTITMDVPLFIRMLEYAREDAKTDMDLHTATENALKLLKDTKVLTMDNYDDIVCCKEDKKKK